MFITKRAFPRRTFLRGVGATLALPLLDSMIPALTAQSRVASPRRLGFVYVPHGVILNEWTPATTGTAPELTPILKPLEPFRDTLNVITNLTRPENGVDTNHAGAPASWLAGVPPKRTAGPDYELGITLDLLISMAERFDIGLERFGGNTGRISLS